jgi:two-component system response regulator YesN
MINFIVISSNPMDGEMFNHIFSRHQDIHYCGQTVFGESGLNLLTEKKTDIIFLEIKPIDNIFNIDIIKKIKKTIPSVYIVCFSLFEQYKLFQNVMDYGAYSFVTAPVDRKRIVRITENIKESIENNDLTPVNSLSDTSYNKIFLDFLNCPTEELENLFEDVWNDYFKTEDNDFFYSVNQCRKFGTELYYYLIDTYDEFINETFIILYNNFMLKIRKINSYNKLKHLLYNFIKDCNCTINKNQQDLSRDRIIKTKKLISQHINENKPITLEIIANKMFISPSYLSRTFKKIEGIKFIDYVNYYRLDKAKFLLSTTNDTIENIAFICGYNEPNSFRRLFKKKLGITPNAYRSKKKTSAKIYNNTI